MYEDRTPMTGNSRRISHAWYTHSLPHHWSHGRMQTIYKHRI